jgi:hypothetical protein
MPRWRTSGDEGRNARITSRRVWMSVVSVLMPGTVAGALAPVDYLAGRDR